MKGIAQAKGQLAGSKIAEKELGNKSEDQQHALAVIEVCCTLGRTDKTVAGGLMELNSQFGKVHSECWVQFWTPEYKPHIHRLEQSSKQQILRKKKVHRHSGQTW